jgi:aminopeptidase N
MLRNILLTFALLAALHSVAQPGKFTRADSLRGSIGVDRAWWKVMKYDVWVHPDLRQKDLKGRTTIFFQALVPGQRMQIDLQQPMVVDSIITDMIVDDGRNVNERTVPFTREEHLIWAELPAMAAAGDLLAITIYYHGTPRVAPNPPWDGGWIWTKDPQGNPWATVACQGLGASVWYPCKDHQSDKPDRGATLHIVVPDTLVGVGNGRLRGTTNNGNGTTTWHWGVSYPINTYNLVPYIGKYVRIEDSYKGAKGRLALDHWVLEHNEEKARAHFQQVHPMLDCFEEWLGPYPFYRDSYKLVEAPHLGMEHQSAIAYGNGYMNGYRGTDLSSTGHGLGWDFIIVHESGHEWFGNNITTADIADMWIHEGFTQYTEALMVECLLGREAAEDYIIGLRRLIRNDTPVIGPYGVNQEGSGDMYPKGANVVHMVRQLLDDDSRFKQLLRYLNQRLQYSVTTSARVEQLINDQLSADLRPLFDQYLRHTEVPVLQWALVKGRLWYRWTNCTDRFAMNVRLELEGRDLGFQPVAAGWRSIPVNASRKAELKVDRNFYVGIERAGKEELRFMR